MYDIIFTRFLRYSDIVKKIWYHTWYHIAIMISYMISYLFFNIIVIYPFLALFFHDIAYDIIYISYEISSDIIISWYHSWFWPWYGPISYDMALWYQYLLISWPYDITNFLICCLISWHLVGGMARVGDARGQVLHLLRPRHRQRAGDGCAAELRRSWSRAWTCSVAATSSFKF